jgi:hypothetical protein
MTERAYNGGTTGLRPTEAARFRRMAASAENLALELRESARMETEGVTLKLTETEVRHVTWALYLAQRLQTLHDGTQRDETVETWRKIQQQAGY